MMSRSDDTIHPILIQSFKVRNDSVFGTLKTHKVSVNVPKLMSKNRSLADRHFPGHHQNLRPLHNGLRLLEIDHLNKNPVYAEFRQNLQRRKTARSPLIFGVRGCPDMHMKAEIGKFDDM